jgi:hypothetical protein
MDLGDDAEFVDDPLVNLVMDDDARNEAEHVAIPNQEPNHRHIVDLGFDANGDAEPLAERFELATKLAVTSRDDDRLLADVTGKAKTRERSGRYDADWLTGQATALQTSLGSSLRCSIG